MVSFIRLLLVVTIAVGTCSANCTDGDSLSNDHSRIKRWLTFYPNGGTAKIILGFMLPIRFAHKLFRQLNAIINLQANYNIPQTLIWPVPASIFKNRLNNEYVDRSRSQLYQLLEAKLDSWGSNGRQCVLRAICEIAEAPLSHNGMIGEILDVIFTPYEVEEIDDEYRQAKLHGTKGANCGKLYRKCPTGHGLLELISVVKVM
ncbi:uncharacterized protein LOC129726539 [Wyeomyia smithii]|uniref:uncharacterized protein LOC129726539 n=1 Tax=Wyeomyia smithii TaxID=174621 RepID=UPI002468005C|nr:uncharacterized protein LOC129726539 [Wyeomyia smithii]